MRSVLLVPLLSLACGCSEPTPVENTHREEEVIDSRNIQLPTAIAVKALSSRDEHVVVLNVNRLGQIALPPAEIRPGTPGFLKTKAEAFEFLQHRARTDREAALPARFDPGESVIVLRIDTLARFEKAHTIMTAAREVGYVKFRCRALQLESLNEGEFQFCCPTKKDGDIPAPRHTVRVLADNAGRIANLTVFGETLPTKLEHGTDLVALLHSMQAIAQAAERDSRDATLTIEADPRLLHAHLVQVIDISTRAGFRAVWPSLLNEKP